MVKNTRAVFLFLVPIYLCIKYGDAEKLGKKSQSFVCDFNNSTLKLVIRNGLKDEQVIKCLETYNTSETLIFSNSRLKRIPEYLDILKGLVNLDLSQNEITAVSFDTSKQMCNNLKRLVLDDNDIYVLRAGNLDCLESLEKFYLANNNLSLIENGTFSVKLKALDYVHLVNNNLTIFDSSLISKVLLSSKTYIGINASRNRITGFTNSVNITINDINRSTSFYIVLTHNDITTVDIDYYFKMFLITHPMPQLFNLWNCGFDARFNPFVCDCALFPLALALRKFYTMDPDNPVFSITCGTPKNLDGMMVRKVQADQFNCSVTRDCPDSCTCIKTIAIGLITVDCSSTYHVDDLPMTCPVADRININIKSNDMIKLSSREYLLNVTVFDVSQCAIADIDPSIVKTLEGRINRSIYLHDNNLESIPNTFETFKFGKGQVLTIDGNPFTCDCHTLWVKKWLLSNKEHVYNQYKIICATGPGKGRAMIEVPDNNFVCQSSLTFVDMLFIIIGSLIGIIVLFSFAACKKDIIQVFIISHFNVCKTTCRKRIHRRLRYDIFIGHSSEDNIKVNKIVKYLKGQDPPYNVIIRDEFPPNRPFFAELDNVLKSSHVTIFAISNEFLRNSVHVVEFRETDFKFRRRKINTMVLIILEDLNTNLLIPELKSYLEARVCIKYSDKHIWAKLSNRLPIIISPDNDKEERTPLIKPM